MAAACVAEDGPVSVKRHQPVHQVWLAGEPVGDGQRRVDLHVVLGVPDAPRAGTRPRHRRRCRDHAAPTWSVTGRGEVR